MIHRQKSISERAHEIWEQEGRPEGRAAEHWEQARAELEEVEDQAGAAPGATKKSAAKKTEAQPKGGAAKSDAGVKDKAPAKSRSKGAAPKADASIIDRDVAVLGEDPKPKRSRPKS